MSLVCANRELLGFSRPASALKGTQPRMKAYSCCVPSGCAGSSTEGLVTGRGAACGQAAIAATVMHKTAVQRRLREIILAPPYLIDASHGRRRRSSPTAASANSDVATGSGAGLAVTKAVPPEVGLPLGFEK